MRRKRPSVERLATGGFRPSPCENSNGRAAADEFEPVFGPFSASTGSAERKNSFQMRRLQTISEFSHSLDPKQSFYGPTALKRTRSFRPRSAPYLERRRRRARGVERGWSW
jgi:hypothetical protein